MSEATYVTRYNAAAAAKGSSCAIEAVSELNDALKVPVTAALQKVMTARPDDPIRFVASCLKQFNEAKYISDRKSITVEDVPDVEVHMERASQRPSGCVTLRLTRYNLVGMQCPSFHELQQEIDSIIAAQPDCSGVTVVVKENDPRKDLVFVQGIPFYADLSHQLRQLGGNSPLKKKETPQSALLRAASKYGRTHNLQDIVGGAKAAKKPVKYSFLPSPLAHPLQAIEVIDAIVGVPTQEVAKPSGAADVLPTKLSPVIIVSYHHDTMVLRQLLTVAATAAQPIAEIEDIKAIVEKRKASLAERQKQSFGAHMEYWKQVRIRRETRDQRREDRDELRIRKEQTMLTAVGSQAIDDVKAVEKLHAESTITVERNKKAAAQRYNRRQREDGAFLDVCRWHREQSAIRIQSMVRGAKARAKWKEAAKSKGEGFEAKPTATAESRHKQLTNIDAPVLLQRALRHLRDIHGEQFVNSIELEKKGFVRTIPLWVPKRTRVHHQIDEDESSEEESWEEVAVELPTIPSAARTKSFNPFVTLKTAARHAGYDALENAVFDSVHFSGFSSVQTRAYAAVCDMVLMMVHATFIELRHRNQATSYPSFAKYFEHNCSEMLAWKVVPNFVAQSTALLQGTPLRDGPLDPLQDRFLCMSDAPERPPWGRFAPNATDQSLWHKELAVNVFAVLDAPDANRMKGIVQTMTGGTNAITWISTAPQPYVYVHGKTFVACERRRDQVTPDHPVPHLLADVAKRQALTPSVDASVDGRSRSPSLGMPSAPQSPMPTPRSPDLKSFTVFGVNMSEWEKKLRLELIHLVDTEGVLSYFTLPDGSNAGRAEEVGDLLSRSLYYAPYFSDCIKAPVLVRKEFTPFPKSLKNDPESGMVADASVAKDMRRTSGHAGSTTTAMGSKDLAPSSSVAKSGRYRRSHSRSGGTGSGEHLNSATGSKSENGLDLPTRSPGSISLTHNESHANIQTPSHGITLTPNAVAYNVYEEVSVDGEFVRMPMLDVGGQTWLGFLDAFLSRCFTALKGNRKLAVGVYDASSMFYACCAALLSSPIERHNDPESPLFHSGNHFDDEIVNDFTTKLGGETAFRAKTLVDELLSQAHDGQVFTKAVTRLKEAAQLAESPVQVRENIILATQRIERYCWLIMLAYFLLTSPPLAGAAEFPSFATWALSKRNAAAVQFLVDIDPWALEPKKCPDPQHVAYSNMYKRWDSKADTKQMV